MFYLLNAAAPAVRSQLAADAPIGLQGWQFAGTRPKRERLIDPRKFSFSQMEVASPGVANMLKRAVKKVPRGLH